MTLPTRRSARCASIATGVLLVLCSGCEAVPTLTFEGPGEDAATADGGGMCPSTSPQNATCCGSMNTVPCYGPYCSGTNCASGCDKCAAPDICCSRSANNVVCLANAASCK
jgi:hypothetical protein